MTMNDVSRQPEGTLGRLAAAVEAKEPRLWKSLRSAVFALLQVAAATSAFGSLGKESLGKDSGAALLIRCEAAVWMIEAGGSRRFLSEAQYAQAQSCLGFVDGFMWGHGWAAWREHRDMYYCPPAQLTAAQFIPLLVEYLRARPDRLDARAHVLLFSALSGTYPCQPPLPEK
jgi:Rap1a immunity proteins